MSTKQMEIWRILLLVVLGLMLVGSGGCGLFVLGISGVSLFEGNTDYIIAFIIWGLILMAVALALGFVCYKLWVTRPRQD